MTSLSPAQARMLRVGAVTALLGGALFALADLQHPFIYPKGATFAESAREPLWIWHQTSHMVAVALVLLALPAIHAAQAERVGGLAFAGYAGMLVGFAWLGAFVLGLTMATVIPGTDLASFDAGPPPGLFPQLVVLCFPVTFLSAVVFAVASWRAAVLPRPALALLAASAPLDLLGGSGGLLPLAGGLAMGIAFAWIGARLWTLARTRDGTRTAAGVLAVGHPEREA